MTQTNAVTEQYDILVEGHLGTAVAAHFPEFTLTRQADGATALSGALPDQAALYGVLARIRDLGLTLISVNRVSVDRRP